ncbi:hypothetical protein SprV_0802552600 [Sparganum proliferum]
MTSTNSNDPTPSLSGLASSLPDFWQHAPELYFFRIEATFHSAKITRETDKFYKLVEALPPTILSQVQTLLRDPPTDAPYTKLKAELLRLTSVSDRQRYHALVKEEALGDRKPSELLRRMRSLVGNMKIDDKFFKEMFLERLPTSVQTILASGSDDLEISKLAEMADRMMEVERLSSPTIAQVSQPLKVSTSDLAELKSQIAQLSATVAALQLRRSPGPSRRSFGRDRRRSRSRPRTANLCWYHVNYGDKARRCVHPAPSSPRRETPRPESKCGRALWQLYGSHILRSKRTFELTPAALTSFEQVKALLADATLLTHYHADAPISLMVDASNVAVGAVLQQSLPDSTVPLAFFSKKLSKAETRYSTFGRELLAAYLAVRHFRHLLEDIRHIDGSRNEVADAFSRPSIAHLQLSPGIDLAEMAAEQRRVGSPCDEDVSGLQLQDLPLTTGNGTILCDVSTPSHRPFVPPSLRRKVFSSRHNLSHRGSRATDKLVSDRFIWPGMHKDLKAWTRACLGCQRSKIQRHNKAPIGTFPGPGARFSHVHLDIVGPLPLSNGCSYLLTCVDRFTRWPEAIPLPDIAAPTVVKAFLSRWVAIFGAPSTITTDRGAQFESNLFQSLLSFLGCTRIRTTAYHPAANGMVERFHRQLKASLRAAADPENWTDHLPLVLLGIRSALKPDLDCSAAELVFGATVRLPGEMISPTPQSAVEDPTNLLHRLRQFMRTLSPVPPRSSASPSYLEKHLTTCSHVYLRCDRLRRPLEPPYDGPFRVISRGTKNFRIQRGTREEVVSVDRLKAAVPDTPPDEPCGPLPPAPPPQPSIPPSRILPLPPCPPPTTPTTPSSTDNTVTASHTHSTPVPPVYITHSGRHVH